MNGLPTTTLVQSIVAIIFGTLGLIVSLIGIIAGLLNAVTNLVMLFGGGMLYSQMAGSLVAVMGVVVALSMLVTSVAVLAGGIMVLAKKSVSVLITGGMLAVVHIVLFDILWAITAQSLSVGGMFLDGADFEAMMVVAGTAIGVTVLMVLWSVVKLAFWGWTIMDARKVKAQLGEEAVLNDLNPALA